MQRKPRRSSKDISVAYILIYEKITNFLRVSRISLNGTAEAGPTSELITEIAEIMIWQFVLKELEKQKVNELLLREKRKLI